MKVLKLQTGAQYWRKVVLLWALFGLIGFAISATARDVLPGVLGLLLMVVPGYMLLSRHFWWVARMDGDGVTMMSGKRFAWADLEKVMDVQARRSIVPVQGAGPISFGGDGHNHYELVFKHGRARVFDRVLKNADEVVAAVKAVERGEMPFSSKVQA